MPYHRPPHAPRRRRRHPPTLRRLRTGAERDHRIIFDASPALIFYKDIHNRILRVNRPAAAAIGKEVEDMEGRGTADFYPDEAAAYYADDLEVIRSGVPKLGIIEPIAVVDGEKRWVRTDKIPYRDSTGKIIGVIVFSLDITDQKRAESRLEEALAASRLANKAKSELLAAVSHELRTPLGIMVGFAELLRGEAIDDKSRRTYAEKVVRNGWRLTSMIDEILDIAKIEEGRMALAAAPFSPAALISEVTSQLALAATGKGIELTVHLAPDLPAVAISDAARVQQVLLNLIGNAVKFTDAGWVKVAAAPGDEPGMLAVTVSDTGVGMSPAETAGLFEPFYQAAPLISRKYGGSGLGLALSKLLARRLGGDVTLVATAPGEGSAFRFTFSLALAGDQAARAPEARTGALIANAPGTEPAIGAPLPTVLLVEDNVDVQDLVRGFLPPALFDLTICGDGPGGIDAALAQTPDVVLMDLQLPGMDGLTATRTLRDRGFRRPILAMTAHAMRGQKQACADAGCDFFLSKPLTQADLLAAIAAARAGTMA